MTIASPTVPQRPLTFSAAAPANRQRRTPSPFLPSQYFQQSLPSGAPLASNWRRSHTFRKSILLLFLKFVFDRHGHLLSSTSDQWASTCSFRDLKGVVFFAINAWIFSRSAEAAKAERQVSVLLRANCSISCSRRPAE